jgi:hypothetical protein
MVPELRYSGLVFSINFCPGWAHFILQITAIHGVEMDFIIILYQFSTFWQMVCSTTRLATRTWPLLVNLRTGPDPLIKKILGN